MLRIRSLAPLHRIHNYSPPLSTHLRSCLHASYMSFFCLHHLNTRLQLASGSPAIATMADPSTASQAASTPSTSASSRIRRASSASASKASRSCAHLSSHTLKQLKFVLPGGLVTYLFGTLTRFWRLVEDRGWARYVLLYYDIYNSNLQPSTL